MRRGRRAAVLTAAVLLGAGGVGYALTVFPPQAPVPASAEPSDPLVTLREAAEKTRLRLKQDAVRWTTRHSLQGDYEVLTENTVSPGRQARRLETIDNGRQALFLEYVEEHGLWTVSWPKLPQRHHRPYEAPLDPPGLYADLHHARLQLFGEAPPEQLGSLQRVENGVAVFRREAPPEHQQAVARRLEHPGFRIRERALERQQQLVAGIEHHFSLEHGWLVRLRGPGLELTFDVAWMKAEEATGGHAVAGATFPAATKASSKPPHTLSTAAAISPVAALAQAAETATTADTAAIADTAVLADDAALADTASAPDTAAIADTAAAMDRSDAARSSEKPAAPVQIQPATRDRYPLLASRCWGTDYRQPCDDDAILLELGGGPPLRRLPSPGATLPIGYLPDGDRVVVLRDDLQGRRAFLLDLATGRSTPLGGQPLRWGYTVSAALSPDGQRLILGHQLVRSEELTQYYLAPLQGDATPVGRPLQATDPAWLRDGSGIVLSTPDDELLRLGLDGAVSRLTDGTQPVPLDEGHLLLRRGSRLHSLELSSGRVRRLAEGFAGRGPPAVSPDGEQLLFLWQDGFRYVGERVSIANLAQRHRLVLPPGRFRHPRWR